MRMKRNLVLVNTIVKLKKENPEVAKILAGPRKKAFKINLEELNEKIGNDSGVLIIGKVLGTGDIKKKAKIVAWSFSKEAEAKISKAKGEAILITEEIKKNPKLGGMKIIQ